MNVLFLFLFLILFSIYGHEYEVSCIRINVPIIIPKCGSPKGRETVIFPAMAMTARSVLRTATSVDNCHNKRLMATSVQMLYTL